MKPLVIYHADCTDGFGAAFAAWLKLGDEAEYLPMAYGSDWKKLVPAEMDLGSIAHDREVYILDFSFPRDVTDYIFDAAKRVIWLDHHKTALEMWCGKCERGMRWHELRGRSDEVFILLDDNKSGAMLAWEYFHPNTTPPKLICHIDDRDRWQFKMEGSKELHAALQSHKPWNFRQWKESFVDSPGDILSEMSVDMLKADGESILRAQDQNVASMAKQARSCAIKFVRMLGEDDDGFLWNGIAVNANLHQSELGHVLATQSGTYGLIWCVAANGKVNCSLRSNGEYDVSAIAKAFGGGGHKNAAGFETDISTVMGWLNA
ncbi:MAG TPA: DHHA1 domain-containing protein [Candidatus Paceibacterota bacterium]